MAAAQENGKIRIVVTDPQKIPMRMAYENRTEQLARSITPSEQVPFPALPVVVGAKHYIKLEVIADAADTIKYTLSTIQIPVTIYSVRNGQMVDPRPSMLVLADFGWSADIALRAGVPEEIGAYQVPEGLAVQLGNGIARGLMSESKIYIQLMDDTA